MKTPARCRLARLTLGSLSLLLVAAVTTGARTPASKGAMRTKSPSFTSSPGSPKVKLSNNPQASPKTKAAPKRVATYPGSGFGRTDSDSPSMEAYLEAYAVAVDLEEELDALEEQYDQLSAEQAALAKELINTLKKEIEEAKSDMAALKQHAAGSTKSGTAVSALGTKTKASPTKQAAITEHVRIEKKKEETERQLAEIEKRHRIAAEKLARAKAEEDRKMDAAIKEATDKALAKHQKAEKKRQKVARRQQKAEYRRQNGGSATSKVAKGIVKAPFAIVQLPFKAIGAAAGFLDDFSKAGGFDNINYHLQQQQGYQPNNYADNYYSYSDTTDSRLGESDTTDTIGVGGSNRDNSGEIESLRKSVARMESQNRHFVSHGRSDYSAWGADEISARKQRIAELEAAQGR